MDLKLCAFLTLALEGLAGPCFWHIYLLTEKCLKCDMKVMRHLYRTSLVYKFI
jgi:hypothetical protein